MAFQADSRDKIQAARLKFIAESYFPLVHILMLCPSRQVPLEYKTYQKTKTETETTQAMNEHTIGKLQALESLIKLVCPYSRLRRYDETMKELWFDPNQPNRKDLKTFSHTLGGKSSLVIVEEVSVRNFESRGEHDSTKPSTSLSSWYSDFTTAREKHLKTLEKTVHCATTQYIQPEVSFTNNDTALYSDQTQKEKPMPLKEYVSTFVKSLSK
mmetsp:Transcript_10353/g.12471  ORF Transcript_10353/g.12471 Transcript_10353/m.12471 type:complete len:213 (-) Transcript_10353:878-1516(-)